jgi:NAD(P)-dependent dehydrogenase (short-subunit alcohol dehydrogenase family)
MARMAPRSHVVTGAARGVGRAVAERLLAGGDAVVAVDRDADALRWVAEHDRGIAVAGDAGDETLATHAAARAQDVAPLAGWVNNAAVFRDAWLHDTPARAVLDLVGLNLGAMLAGCAAAVEGFLAAGAGGAIVNVSSHQAERPVRGALPYATAKAAIEGLTRALAVDYGPHGVRVNAVALGSIATERHAALLDRASPEQAARIGRGIAALHPLGRIGRADEAAAAIVYLLSDGASFVSGATVPVDGGRAALGLDPEAA